MTICKLSHRIIDIKGKGGKIHIIKNAEEIRLTTEFTQSQFAKLVGMSLRTYQERLSGSHSDWKISELIDITKFNNGEILVEYDGKQYVITIHELGLKEL